MTHITIGRAKLEQVLEALDLAQSLLEKSGHHSKIIETYTVIKQALEQPVQEPVAWMYQCSRYNPGPVLMQHKQDWAKSGSGIWTEAPLFANPPAPAAQVPLTNTEFGEQWCRQTGRIMGTDKQLLLQAKRVTETAHGITEGQP